MNNAQSILKTVFGFDEFRPGQREVISAVLNGQNTLAVMPTGGGKSLCYQIPALLNPGVTIVVSPLISLMKDQVDALHQNGVEAAAINSITPRDEVNPILRQAYEGKLKLIYVTPERLNMDYFRYQLNYLAINLVAVDEAHCISQWGHDFRPAYRQLQLAIAGLKSKPVTLALTATATPQVQQDIGQQLAIAPKNFIVTNFTRPNISFKVMQSHSDTKRYLYEYLKNHEDEAGIIYANTRKGVETIAEYLSSRGLKVAPYHAGMDNETRARIQDDFQFDRVPVIVATNAFGMGIDKSNVRFVVHATSAPNLESYYQEAGRAGRDGLPSEAIMLFHASDMQQYRRFIEMSEADEEYQNVQYRKLQAVIDYVNTPRCLQQAIVEYFGQHCDPCGHCSNCLDHRKLIDVTRETKLIITAVSELHSRFGKGVVAQVVTGSQNERMRQLQASELSSYDTLDDFSKQQAVSLIDYLCATGYLELRGNQYPVVAITKRGWNVLHGQEHVKRRLEGKPDRKATQITDELPEDRELFAKLRVKRWELAQKQGVPAFMIFSDRTLHDMARKRPQSLTEMLDVAGVGQRKLDQYGQAMLNVIQAE
ncbi:DNA helicase RecQ [uncultured Limosilactobacillus sp.]|uniref:DNA helicase RecQ n=1 Tax=uncultured Limosilactobacillus sp. TaxID=2837629 RepID=UPI0025ECD0D9|nr:DNA helicase RecQ [uncultured Limosilactobacillus sp.]